MNGQWYFLTQQVGWTDCKKMNELLGAPINNKFIHWDLAYH